MPLRHTNSQAGCRTNHRAPMLAALAFGGSLLLPNCSTSTTTAPIDRLAFLREVRLRLPTRFAPFRRTGSASEVSIAEGEFIVYYNTSSATEIGSIKRWIEAHGARRIGTARSFNLDQYQVNPGVDMNLILDYLQARPEVLTAQPNFEVRPLTDPNPPVTGTIDDGTWWIRDVNLPRAWSITTGQTNVPVGLVDAYIDLNWVGLAKPGNYQVIFCSLPDGTVYFAERFNDPHCRVQEHTHGTSVATVLAARGDDGIPGVGVAWQNPIIAVDISAGLSAVFEDIGVRAALALGAKVVNVSSGIAHFDPNDHRPFSQQDRAGWRAYFIEGVRRAVELNAMLVFASGNDGARDDSQMLPAQNASDVRHFNSNVLIVGGTDELGYPFCALSGGVDYTGQVCRIFPPTLSDRCNCMGCGLWLTSNPGTTEGGVVAISAPGYRIATRVGNGFGAPSGTSFSSPITAGIAALTIGLAPDDPISQIRSILIDTARPSTGCRQIGHGIIDAAAAVERARTTVGTRRDAGVDATRDTQDVGPTQTWIRRYPAYWFFHSVQATPDGNIVVGGEPNVFQRNISRRGIIMLDSQGNQLWERLMPENTNAGGSVSEVYALADGSVMYIGMAPRQTTSSPNYYRSMIIAKLNTRGEIAWEHAYGDESATTESRGSSLIRASDGTFIGVGIQYQHEIGQLNRITASHLVLFKIDITGREIWRRRVPNDYALDTAPFSIFPDSIQEENGYLLVSGTYGTPDNWNAILQINFADNRVIERRYDRWCPWRGCGANRFVMSDQLSGVRAVGGLMPMEPGTGIIRGLDRNQNELWRRNFDGRVRQIITTRDGNFVAVGLRKLIKFDVHGTVLWERTFTEEGYFVSVDELPDGFIIAGTRGGENSVGWLNRTDSEGNLR